MKLNAEYIDHMGSDITIVNAARVSFHKESYWQSSSSDPGNTLEDKDEKLIKYLAREGHWTPFGHGQITLRESVPIFVARQRFKHQIGFVYNEISRRYVDDDPEFYTPSEWRGRPKDNKKQGSSEEVITKMIFRNNVESWSCEIDNAYQLYIEQAEFMYRSLLEAGIAPEQARMVLPQSMITEYYVTGSLAAWARAYNLRSDSHAQKEIRDLANLWDDVINPLFPTSWTALTNKDTTNYA